MTIPLRTAGLFATTVLAISLAIPAGVSHAEEGDEIWAVEYEGPGLSNRNRASAVAVDSARETVYVTGGSECCFTTIAYSSTGEQRWIARDIIGSATDIAVDPTTGNVFVMGNEGGRFDSTHDIVTEAYSPSGARLWAARYASGGDMNDSAVGIAVDPTTKHVYVSVWAYKNFVPDQQLVTIAYSHTGVELWTARYRGPAQQYAQPRALTVDPVSGDVYVVGHAVGDDVTHVDAAMVVYSSVGTLRFARVYIGPGNGNDSASDVTVDPLTGHAYLTGTSAGVNGVDDFLTIAYDTEGSRLWVARFDGTGTNRGQDVATAIAVDPTFGHVYVTGTSSANFALVSYFSSGRLRWVAPQYNGPGSAGDGPAAIAVDPATGTVYVTGTSWGSGTGFDFATVAYARGTGSIRWTSRYEGELPQDYAADIAVDPETHQIYVVGRIHTCCRQPGNFTTVAYAGS